MCAPYVEARPKGGARAEKEIGEKAQKIIRYQIVSTFSTRCAQVFLLFSVVLSSASQIFGLPSSFFFLVSFG